MNILFSLQYCVNSAWPCSLYQTTIVPNDLCGSLSGHYSSATLYKPTPFITYVQSYQGVLGPNPIEALSFGGLWQERFPDAIRSCLASTLLVVSVALPLTGFLGTRAERMVCLTAVAHCRNVEHAHVKARFGKLADGAIAISNRAVSTVLLVHQLDSSPLDPGQTLVGNNPTAGCDA